MTSIGFGHLRPEGRRMWAHLAWVGVGGASGGAFVVTLVSVRDVSEGAFAVTSTGVDVGDFGQGRCRQLQLEGSK